MLKTKIILVLLLAVGVFSSCKKDGYEPEKQLKVDDALIKDFIAKNSIVAVKDEKSGIYYQIITPGTGTLKYTPSTQVSVIYAGRLLNGSIFDSSTSPRTFALGDLILGWQVGIPLIQKGGKIRLLIPSTLAYMNQARVGIPENSVLDFTVELTNAQ